jgi:ribosomal protein S18 acetylase RimI-like enzyme
LTLGWTTECTGLRLAPAESESQIRACLPVLRELRPHLGDDAACLAQIRRQSEQGYRLLALWGGDGAVVACAGYRVAENLIRGRFLYVDDLVTRTEERSRGHGERLLQALAEIACELDCRALTLDTGLDNARGQRFYLRHGLDIVAFRLVRPLPAIGAMS